MKTGNTRKWHNRKGFTLAETLLAIMILLMVSTIVATGIPVAKNAYEKVVLASNAEVLLSTTISTLRNELGTAQDVTYTAGGAADAAGIASHEKDIITYYNPARGYSSRIFLDTDRTTEGIQFERYYLDSGLAGIAEIDEDLIALMSAEKKSLISSVTATDDLYVTYDSVAYDADKGIITFTGLSVNRASGGTGLAKRDQLSIRILS